MLSRFLRRFRRWLPLVAALGTAVPAPAVASCQCADSDCCRPDRQTDCSSRCSSHGDTQWDSVASCVLVCDCAECSCHQAQALQPPLAASERRSTADVYDECTCNLHAVTTQAFQLWHLAAARIAQAPNPPFLTVPLRVLLCVWLN